MIVIIVVVCHSSVLMKFLVLIKFKANNLSSQRKKDYNLWTHVKKSLLSSLLLLLLFKKLTYRVLATKLLLQLLLLLTTSIVKCTWQFFAASTSAKSCMSMLDSHMCLLMQYHTQRPEIQIHSLPSYRKEFERCQL